MRMHNVTVRNFKALNTHGINWAFPVSADRVWNELYTTTRHVCTIRTSCRHQLKTDIRGVNVWPYASVMLDESSQINSIATVTLVATATSVSFHILIGLENVESLTTWLDV